MESSEVLRKLQSLSDPKNVAGMARFGISSKNTLGVPVPELRAIAKQAGKDHKIALRLWKSGIHEARILASMVEEPAKVTEAQADAWVAGFDSWDVCDQCCMNLFWTLPFANKKIFEWAKRDEEYVRRAAFALIASISVKDKKMPGSEIERFFPLIKEYSTDSRNYVRKAVNWALRQIGKRNSKLNLKAVAVAKEIQRIDSKSAKWVAADALRELTSGAVQKRLKK
ncbi:MAG: DNA alkylation repair protein [archaeon]